MTQYRKNYLDVLRILATFGVIIIHTACRIIDNTSVLVDVDSREWFFGILYDSMTRFAVPLFIMISGALFLNRDISIKKIWGNYILHLVIVFFTWTVLYDVVARGTRSIASTIQWAFTGMGRFSFLLMMVALYIVYPLIKKIVAKDKVLLKYFVFVNFVYVFVFNTILPNMDKYIIDTPLFVYFDSIHKWFDRIPFVFLSWMLLYFSVGYVLDKVTISRRIQLILEIGGGMSTLFTVAMTYYDSMKAGNAVFDWMSYATLNVFLQSVGLFVFVKCHSAKVPEKVLQGLNTVSNCSLGIYLLHTYILDYLLPNTLNIDIWSFWLPTSIPVMASIVFAICLLVSWILNHIPVIRYFV